MTTNNSKSFNPHVCAFCHSKVPDGASVCAACGAFKGVKADAGGIPFWPGILLMLFGGIALLSPHISEGGVSAVLWGLAFFAAGALLFYWSIQDHFQKTWLRRN
jgi:hypothetical protein